MRRWRVVLVGAAVVATVLGGLHRDGAGPLALHLAVGGWLSGVTTLMVLDALRVRPAGGRVLAGLAWSMAPVILVVQFWVFGVDPREWDLLWAPASVLTVAGWTLVNGLPERLRRALKRLGDRGVLVGGPGGIDHLSIEMDRLSRRWACAFGAGALVAFTATGPWVSGETDGIWLGPFGTAYLVPILLGVVLAGALSGRVASYGRLGAAIRGHGMRIRVIPGHQDGAGGLRPIGAYLLHQSLLAAVPPMYMGAWLLVFAFTDGKGIAGRYQSFETQFQWLLPLSVVAEVLAFVVPMWSMHTMMQAEKESTLWAESDRLSRQVEQARNRLCEDGVVQDREDAERRLDSLIERVAMLERAPTWPVDASIRRRFTLRNVGLLMPLVSYALKNAALLEKLVK